MSSPAILAATVVTVLDPVWVEVFMVPQSVKVCDVHVCSLVGSELDYSRPDAMVNQECRTRIIQSPDTIVEYD